MHVFFINPSGGYAHEYPPIGLLYLAAYIREKGHEVGFFDEGALRKDPTDNIQARMRDFQPDVYCLSLYTTNILGAYWLMKLIKLEKPGAIIIVGGPHATSMPERTLLECPEIDFLVSGEGEEVLAELLGAIEDGQPTDDISGISFRPREGSIRSNPRHPFIRDLDSIPFPAYDLLSGFLYGFDPVRKGKRIGSIITSRGCPFDCTFCNKAVFGSTYRRRSPENVVREIQYQQAILGMDEIYFMDDLFAANRRWLESFYAIMDRERIRMPWKCMGRVDTLKGEDYREMYRNGCHTIQFGVESGNQAILDDIRKNTRKEQILEAFRLAGSAGLNTYGFFMIGHRLDTEHTIRETFRFVQKLSPDFIAYFCLVLFPGTEVFKHGPEDEKYDWRRIGYIHWDKARLPISICEVSPALMAEFERRSYIEYYSSFRYIRKNIIPGFFRKGFTRKKFEFFAYYSIQSIFDRLKGNKKLFR